MEVAGENKCGEITSQKTRSWEVNDSEDIEDWVVSTTPWERVKTHGLACTRWSQIEMVIELINNSCTP